VHAAIFYSNYFRTGLVPHDHPAFRNAQELLSQILGLIDLTIPSITSELTDGQTSKFLVRVGEGLDVESVVIPMQSGGTLCVSSQVGCRMGCSFCETGRMGLLKHLEAEEIVAQLFIARVLLKQPIRNIVFMGMGEPFDNYDNVLKAARVMMDAYGFGYGKNHLTISTSGRVEEIDRYAEEPGDVPNLAISLSAPLDALRNKLMPINRKFNLERLRASMELYTQKTRREILVAYVLMKGVNDSLEHAELLVEYLKNLSVKINLIPYNPQTHDRYQRSDPEQIQAFYRKVRSSGMTTLLRNTKGDEIMAACGQLGKPKKMYKVGAE
jgi:23S rRNA (adenine2503-C2)-methyltransferase